MVPNVMEDPTTCLFISIHITVAPPSNFAVDTLKAMDALEAVNALEA